MVRQLKLKIITMDTWRWRKISTITRNNDARKRRSWKRGHSGILAYERIVKSIYQEKKMINQNKVAVKVLDI